MQRCMSWLLSARTHAACFPARVTAAGLHTMPHRVSPAGRGPVGCGGPSADQVLHPVQVCTVAAGRWQATGRQGGGQRTVCIALGGRAAVLVLWEPCRGGVMIVIGGMNWCFPVVI